MPIGFRSSYLILQKDFELLNQMVLSPVSLAATWENEQILHVDVRKVLGIAQIANSRQIIVIRFHFIGDLLPAIFAKGFDGIRPRHQVCIDAHIPWLGIIGVIGL